MDFGLTTIVTDVDCPQAFTEELRYTAWWTAPEILSEQGTYSKEADVFSFAMVTIEVG